MSDRDDGQGPVKTAKDLLDHEYDGIREYDNPTPGWWHIIFLGSVLFSLLYYVFFTFSPLSWTPESELARREAVENRKIFGALGDLTPDRATIMKLSKDDRLMIVAQGMFISNCASCHASDGGGINGVNLTDDHYKSVKVVEDIHKVLMNGAGAGSMPPQGTRYSQNELVLLSAYVVHLRGTKPASPRQAEGEVIPPFAAGEQVSMK